MTKSSEAKKSYSKSYHTKHKERISAYRKAYHAAHLEEDAARNKVWRTTHREEIRAKGKVWQAAHKDEARLRRYGLSQVALEAMIEKQGGVCAICKKPGWIGKGPHVDHDHVTKKIRGILCFTCNTALGLFGDSIKIARAMVDYLDPDRKIKKEGE